MPEIYGVHTKKNPQSATKHPFCSNPHFIFEKALGMDIEEAIWFSNELMNAAQYTSKMQLHLQHNAIIFLNTKHCIFTFQKSQLEIIITSIAILNNC